MDKDNDSKGTLKHNPFAGLAGRVPLSVKQAREHSAEVRAKTDTKADVPLPRKEFVFTDKVVLRQETKGRHGKTVTRITGLDSADVPAIATQLKKALGCGATVEGDDLILLGAVEERAIVWFQKAGAIRIATGRRTVATDHGTQVASQAPPTSQHSALDKSAAKISSGKQRSELRPGQRVAIVLKADQPTGKLTEGVIETILTHSDNHPHGIKVRLQSGQIGRVKHVLRD